MKWIHRDAESRLIKLASSFPAVLLTGPRQSGKSSLLRKTFPDAKYITFDDPFLVMQAEGSPHEFMAQCMLTAPRHIILDEIQYVPDLFRYIKLAIDEDRLPGRFLLTGSQSFQLGQMGSESLAGRMALMELAPLGVSELRAVGIEKSFDLLLFRGGFPELWNTVCDPTDWYPAYISTYLQRDLRSLSQVADLMAFSRLLRAVALRSGTLLNYADLSRDVGVAPNTAKQWVSLLVSSGIATTVEGWSNNPTSRLVKSPKLYLNDSGLLCAFLGFRSSTAMLESSLFGAVWETWCFAQMRTWLLNRGRLHQNLFYWRTKDGKEVDFIFEEDQRLYALECKSKEMPDQKDFRGIKLLIESLPEREIIPTILCRTKEFIPRMRDFPVSLDNACHLDRLFGD